jgi:hypothetical protein
MVRFFCGLKFKDESKIVPHTIVGESGTNSVAPEGKSTFAITGTGFISTTKILYKLKRNDISIQNECTFVNSTMVTCKTNDIYSLGVSLPISLQLDFSMNGINYQTTSLFVLYSKSSKLESN